MDHKCTVGKIIEEFHILAMLRRGLSMWYMRKLLLPQSLEGFVSDQATFVDAISFVVNRGVTLPLVKLVDFPDIPLKGSDVIVRESDKEGMEDFTKRSFLFFELVGVELVGRVQDSGVVEGESGDDLVEVLHFIF